jgi:hypothetical protein
MGAQRRTKATTACTIIDMKNAMSESIVPSHSTRNEGVAREANALENQRFADALQPVREGESRGFGAHSRQ